MEEIVAHRAFGVAETFLGHQVNASTSACFTRSLNYIFLPFFLVQLKPLVIADQRERRSMRNPHWRSNAARYISFYGMYICHQVAKAARRLGWIGLNVIGFILINRFFSLARWAKHSREKVTSKTHTRCPTCNYVVFFRRQIARSIRSRVFLERDIEAPIISLNLQIKINFWQTKLHRQKYDKKWQNYTRYINLY